MYGGQDRQALKMIPWHRKASAKTQVSLTRFLQSEVKIIHKQGDFTDTFRHTEIFLNQKRIMYVNTQ